MKKAISAFLTVGFVLAIVYVVLGAILIPVSFAGQNGLDASNLVLGIFFVLFGVANLVGLILIRKKWPLIKSKSEVKKIAVWSIVLGALLTEFPIVAGILMLAMPAEQYESKE